MTTFPANDPRPPLLPPAPRLSRRPNPWLIRLPVLFISGGILLGLVLAIFAAAFELRYADKIVPGVWSYGLNLSGMTRREAEDALRGQFTYDREAVFTFRDGDHFWQLTAGDLGVSFDAAATAGQAFTSGHSGDLLRDLFSQASIWLNGRAISPLVRYDQSVAVERLEAIAAEVNRLPVDAALRIDGTNVVTTPGQTGRTLDIHATLDGLDAIITDMNTGAELPLVIHETPPLVWDAESAAAQVRAALSGPVTLTADDQNGGTLGPWVAGVDQIAALLTVQLVDNGDGTRSYVVDVNAAAFRAYLEGLARGLIASPKDGRFHFNETTHELEIIQPSVDGRSLNLDETLKRLKDAIFDPTNRTVPMVFEYVPPRYHNNITAASLGITQQISEATTYFTGSTLARRANIIEAASRFDGVIIGPGEEFSFNSVLGDITTESGFVQGKVIFNGRTVDGVGGGVCQVSTTAFQAAFKAGFPIIERYSHGYRVGYYEIGGPPGLDAAIFQPTADFRFQNDTPYHLLIETSVFPGSDAVQFRFYSTNPGRKVVVEQPVIRDIVPALPTVFEANSELQPGQSLQVDWAEEGASVSIVRVIEDLNGAEISRYTLFTQYQPWAAVIQVAPGDPRLSGG